MRKATEGHVPPPLQLDPGIAHKNLKNTCILFSLVKSSVSVTQTELPTKPVVMFLGNYQMNAFESTFEKKCKSPAGNDKTKFELRMETGWVINN